MNFSFSGKWVIMASWKEWQGGHTAEGTGIHMVLLLACCPPYGWSNMPRVGWDYDRAKQGSTDTRVGSTGVTAL